MEVGHPSVSRFLSRSLRPQSGRVNSMVLHTTFTLIRATADNTKRAGHELWSSITSICKTVSLDCIWRMVSPWMFSDKDKSMDLMTHSNSNSYSTLFLWGKTSLKLSLYRSPLHFPSHFDLFAVLHGWSEFWRHGHLKRNTFQISCGLLSRSAGVFLS